MNTIQQPEQILRRLSPPSTAVLRAPATRSAAFLALAGLLLATAAPAAELSAETKANMQTALHSEGYEYLLYRTFAAEAKLNGNRKAAQLLKEIAKEEGEDHFTRELLMVRSPGRSDTNLAQAMKSEIDEQVAMYTKFAEAADKAGDTGAAALFREISQDEKKHYELLQRLQSGK